MFVAHPLDVHIQFTCRLFRVHPLPYEGSTINKKTQQTCYFVISIVYGSLELINLLSKINSLHNLLIYFIKTTMKKKNLNFIGLTNLFNYYFNLYIALKKIQFDL